MIHKSFIQLITANDFTLAETDTRAPTAWLDVGAEIQFTSEGPARTETLP